MRWYRDGGAWVWFLGAAVISFSLGYCEGHAAPRRYEMSMLPQNELVIFDTATGEVYTLRSGDSTLPPLPEPQPIPTPEPTVPPEPCDEPCDKAPKAL